jgi:hypothetical protein
MKNLIIGSLILLLSACASKPMTQAELDERDRTMGAWSMILKGASEQGQQRQQASSMGSSAEPVRFCVVNNFGHILSCSQTMEMCNSMRFGDQMCVAK